MYNAKWSSYAIKHVDTGETWQYGVKTFMGSQSNQS